MGLIIIKEKRRAVYFNNHKTLHLIFKVREYVSDAREHCRIFIYPSKILYRTKDNFSERELSQVTVQIWILFY